MQTVIFKSLLRALILGWIGLEERAAQLLLLLLFLPLSLTNLLTGFVFSHILFTLRACTCFYLFLLFRSPVSASAVFSSVEALSN